jgi:hypothetical protein
MRRTYFWAGYAGENNVEAKHHNESLGRRGLSFADRVAAGFLAQMLKRRFPLEPDLGVIAELHFETRDIGHFLDVIFCLLP